MIHIAKTEEVYINSMGKRFKILAIADNADEANDYMAKHDRAAVIACIGELAIMADKYEAEKQ